MRLLANRTAGAGSTQSCAAPSSTGRLKPGARMPSTRSLGKQYSLARGTVVSAFDQLQAEGYTSTEVGVRNLCSLGRP